MKGWAAIGFIALIAACVPGEGPTASPPAASTPSPTPLGERLNVADSTPVILYHDPAAFDQLDAMTWDGKIRGRIGPGYARGGVPNAQGTLFWTFSDIRDRTNRVIAPLDVTKTAMDWADDGRHYCSLVRTGSSDLASPALLQIGAPGGTSTDVARVGVVPPAGSNAGGAYVAACSIEGDRAIVVQSGGQGVSVAEYWVVQLSTGRVLWHRTPTPPVELTVSHDGRLVVENHDGGPSPVYSESGSVTATLNAWVSAFSWDGTLAVTSPTWTGGQVSVTRWRDGVVIWRGPAGTQYGYAYGVVEPGGTRLALGIRDPAFPQKAGFPPVDLFVVSPDGKVTFEQKNIVLFPTL